MADGMSFRGCLSGGGDIFSKSVEKQGGANRTFATGGRCHGWQLEPCTCGLEPLLTFRQKIPTGDAKWLSYNFALILLKLLHLADLEKEI